MDDRFYLLTKFFLYLEGVKAGTEGISQRDNILDLAEKVLAEKSAAKKILARFERILDFFCHHEPEKFFADFLTNEYDLWFADSAQKPVVGSPVKVYVRKKRRSPSLDLLRLIFDENIDVTDLPLFEAFFEHAANPVLGTDELRERIRKVRNLVQNCHIQQRGLQADLLATDLLMQPVIDYDTDNRTGSEFVQAQKEQEIFKDNWIAENPGQADLLHALENHWMLEGNLDVVIIRDREGRLLDIDRRALCRFGHLIHFDVNGFNELWPVERALLAYGDYGQERENIRDYGGTTWHNWRDEITKNFNGDSHAVFRKLLASLSDFRRQT